MTKYAVQVGWDDVPHLSAEAKADLLKSYPPYQRDARTKGVPQLGSGAIYPVPETEIVCDPFSIPAYWPMGYAMDVGWNRTAGILGALDRDHDVLYLTAEHYRSHAEPSIHAAAIRAWGEWLPGVIDPSARGRGQADGQKLFDMYRDLGLMISPADNAREAGIFEVWQRLSTGRLRVFRTLQNWLAEYRLYRRDEKGQVVKEGDHLMDATRYLVVSGLAVMMVDPDYLKAIGRKPRVVTDYDPHAAGREELDGRGMDYDQRDRF
jgi:hypothetical protein